ncbi:unnamed protein product, partial [marine sediment metagenome]
EEKGLIRDPALETAYHDLEDLRDKLQTAQERMFRFSLYLTTYADTEKELRDIETNLRSILESRLIYIKPALYQQKEGATISAIPIGSSAKNSSGISGFFLNFSKKGIFIKL